MAIASASRTATKSKLSSYGGERFLALFLIWRLSREPMYGYRLLGEVRDLGLSPRHQSTVYSLLSRLEKAGFIKGRSQKAGKRMRRTYLTTRKGNALFAKVKRLRIQGQLRGFLQDLLS